MALKFPSSVILFFYLSCFIIGQAQYFLSNLSSERSQTPLDFLKNLNGTHKGNQAKGLSELKKYLAKLGYIDYNSTTIPLHENDDFFDDTLEVAIKRYQKFYDIQITGIIDPETVTLMLKPRCGVPDFLTNSYMNLLAFGYNKNLIGSHYNLTGYLWPPNKRNLTFSFSIGTRTDAYAPIQYALTRWSSVSPFKFSFINYYNFSDVRISFERRDHGDGYPFDGPYGILAHAFFPTDGRLHFDEEENWMAHAEKGGFDLQTVALHELGHILGLGHSQDPKAVMFAYIGERESKDLTLDDIQGILSIYPS